MQMTLFILGASFVLIIGSRSEACGALDDCWLLNIEDYSLTKVICNFCNNLVSYLIITYASLSHD